MSTKKHFAHALSWILRNQTTYLHKDLDQGKDFHPENFRLMDYSDENDIKTWCEMVNHSYDDAEYDSESAHHLLLNHPFIEQNQTAFYVADQKPVATISYGKVKKSADTGGYFRIAVLPEYQGKGIGKELIYYAENEIKTKGASKAEEAIKLKRKQSLNMHFGAGYLPEKSSKERACPRSKAKKLLLKACGYDRIINLLTRQIYLEYLDRKKKGI